MLSLNVFNFCDGTCIRCFDVGLSQMFSFSSLYKNYVIFCAKCNRYQSFETDGNHAVKTIND